MLDSILERNDFIRVMSLKEMTTIENYTLAFAHIFIFMHVEDTTHYTRHHAFRIRVFGIGILRWIHWSGGALDGWFGSRIIYVYFNFIYAAHIFYDVIDIRVFLERVWCVLMMDVVLNWSGFLIVLLWASHLDMISVLVCMQRVGNDITWFHVGLTKNDQPLSSIQ